jgi:RNA polymerase sigma factor (sigma-70 family)
MTSLTAQPASASQVTDDATLVLASRGGDRQAYRRLVARYQGLVCALSFSSCGDVARSEDLAQETFLAAWQGLATLEDAARFKPWLCGIARNLIRCSRRKHGGRGEQWPPCADDATDADPLHAVHDAAPTPAELAGTREEAAAVRRALEALPETYREPLVLFYREEQSVRNVAEALDLSEDAVRQRLSRGRGMLREHLAGVVEHALRRTKPGPALTVAVIASLPAVAAEAKAAGALTTAASGAAAGAAAAAGKAVTALGLLSFLAAPLVTIASTPLLARWVGRAQRTPGKRKYMTGFAWTIGIVNTVFALIIGALSVDPSFILAHPVTFGVVLASAVVLNVAVVLWLSLRADRRLRQMRKVEAPR